MLSLKSIICFINNSMTRILFGSCFLFMAANAVAVNMQYLKYSPVSEFTAIDFEILQTTVVKALDNNENDKESTWINTDSNNSGTITPMDTTTIDGMHCRKTKISNQTKTRSGHAIFTFCKVDGKWKVLK